MKKFTSTVKRTRSALLLFFSVIALTGNAQTWANEAGRFYKNCTGCHNTYGQYPWLNWSQTAPYASLIRAYLLQNKMPPWSPDTTYTRFMFERHISQADKDSIVQWVVNGAQMGDTTKAPVAPTYVRYKLYGTPDLELKIPTFTSNAVSSDSYCCFSLPSGLSQDMYLRAYEIVVGNPKIVHHVIVNVDTTGTVTSDLSGGCFTASGQYSVGGYAPGAEPTVFPSMAPLKAGVRIKKGSNIILQIHYPLGTSGQIDSTKIRLYFYPVGTTGIRPVIVKTPLQNWSMVMPANQVTTYTATKSIGASDISVLACFPHSHKLDTSIIDYAYKGIDTIKLVRINHWDFNFQGYYTYHRLVHVPAGYAWYGKHVYDNTTNNPNNPNNPPQTVTAGTNTTDEMLFDSFMYLTYQTGDENINLDSIIGNDPLVTGIQPIYQQNSIASKQLNVYPNPSTGMFTVNSDQLKVNSVVEVYNLLGERIQSFTVQNSKFTIDLSGQPAGIYIIQANNLHARIVKQ